MAVTMPASTLYVLPFTSGSVTAEDVWTAASYDWATTVTDQSNGSILAPAMGQLIGAWDANTGKLVSFTIDCAQFSPCRQLFSHDPNQAFVTQFVISGASDGALGDALDTSTFNPDWLSHQPTNTASLDGPALLNLMKAAPNTAISVKAGDVLGTLNSKAVEVRCYLADGAIVPLSWAYHTLVDSGYLDPATESAAFVQTPIAPIAALTIAEDPFSILSGTSSRVAIQLSWADAATYPPVTSTQPPTARRFVIELPGNVDSEETKLNLNIGSSAATVAVTIGGAPGNQPASPCTLAAGALDSPVALTLGALDGAGEQVVITAPPPLAGNGAAKVLIVSQRPIQLGGAASDMTNLTATLNDAPVNAFTEAGNGKWTLALDFSDTSLPVPSELVFLTSTSAPILTVHIYPIAINPGAVDAKLGLPLTANGTPSDTRDSLVMEASLTNGGTLAAALSDTLTVQWALSVDCAVPRRAEAYTKQQSSFKVPKGKKRELCSHWIDFTMSSASTSLSAFGASWGPGPMQLQTTSVICDDPCETKAHDIDVAVLAPDASWAGNNGEGAGPLCGDATLSVTVQGSDGSVILTPPAASFKIRGFDLHSIDFATFLSAVTGSLRRVFNGGVLIPQFTQSNLVLQESDFINILLAIFTIESTSTIIQFNPHANSKSIPAMPSVMHQPPPFLPIWGPPAGTGVGQKDPSTIATMFDWRANLDACARILHDCFHSPEITRREQERLTTVAKNQGGDPHDIANSLANVDVSATSAFQKALSADERLYLCVKKYNGRPPPVTSNFLWTDDGFVPHPELGNAIDTWTQNPDPDKNHYIGSFIPQYTTVQAAMAKPGGITTWPPWRG